MMTWDCSSTMTAYTAVSSRLLAVPLMSLYLGGAALVGVVEKGRDADAAA